MATLTSLFNNGLDEMPNDAYNWPGVFEHYFGLIQYTLISILLYLSHLLQSFYPKYWDRYIPEQVVHIQIRSSLIMV